MPDPGARPGRHLAGGPPRQPWDVLADSLSAERAEAAGRATSAERHAGGDIGDAGAGEAAGRVSRLRSDLFDRLPVGGQRAVIELGRHWWLPVAAALVALALTIAIAVHVRPAAAEALPGAGRSTSAATRPATGSPSSATPTSTGSVAPGSAPSMSLAAPVPTASGGYAGTPATPGSPTAGGGSTAGTALPGTTPAVVVVDLAGRVRHPGVLHLAAGSRVVDAIRAAGGALPHTDLTALNLAQPLSDGEQVRVGLPGVAIVAPTPTTGAGSGTGSTGGGTPAPGAAATGPVDVNTATAEGLDALPGIGPVLAARIIAWRVAHGPFGSVDDLVDVPGIGPAILATLRPLVAVGP